mgnify:CR=1 FL=1
MKEIIGGSKTSLGTAEKPARFAASGGSATEKCEGCGERYEGKTTYTPDDVALCPSCAKSNRRVTAREMMDILANEKITQFGGTITYESPNDKAEAPDK